MKVLKESPKEQKVSSLLRRPMRDPVANGVTISQSAVINGAIESKSPTDEHDLGEKVSPRSRQLSMRKSRASGELERDVALSTVQSSAKLPTATPLNPVTPLRWKSTKRIESEKRKLQEEIRTKEVVKDEKKNSKLAKEEKKGQSKVGTASAGINGIETSHKLVTQTSNHFTSENDKRLISSSSSSESTGQNSLDEKAEDRKHSHPVTNGGSNEHAKHCEEGSSFCSKNGGDQAAGDSGTDRKSLAGDESTAITIDFLRARLLAERASSKAAKERIQQLTKKVQELEGRLDQEIQSSRKADEAAREALMKVESFNESKVSSPREEKPPSHRGKTVTDQQVQEFDQALEKCQVPAEVDDTRPDATVNIVPGHTQLVSLEINEPVVSGVVAIPSSEKEKGVHNGVQSYEKIGSQDVNHDGIPIAPSIASTNGYRSSPTNSELQRQEIRFSSEERLHHMWNQMALEMSALAEDKTVEDRVREGLLKWMHQFPSVVQNILPISSEEKKLVLEKSTDNMQQKGGDVPPENPDLDQSLNSKGEAVEGRSLDEASCGEGSRTHDKGLKKVASLIERFEANETVQREWEQGNAKQNSTSRRRSTEGSLSRTNSNPRAPSPIEPQQGHRQEVAADNPEKPLLVAEDPSRNSLATDSSTSSLDAMTVESLLITKDYGKLGTYSPGDSTPSTYPNSPIVGDMARRSGGDEKTPIITRGTTNSSLEHSEFGLEGSMDASLITPPVLSPSSGPSIGEKIGGITINPEDRFQRLEQSKYSKAVDGNCKTPVCRSESSGEIGEPARSQALIGWVNLEETPIPPALTNTDHSSSVQWDASIRDRHLQHERLGPYSQAGNSNAYIRPGHYPTRNEEREIYRGRMESVSRSMEGLGSSWRSLSDTEVDETQLFADTPDAIGSSISGRSGPHMSFQANGGSGWANYHQPEDMEGTSRSLGYPGRDFPRENFRSRSTSCGIDSTSSKVNEVLKALQLAKLSIQNSGTRRSSISNPCYPASECSDVEGDRHNLKMDYGLSDGRVTSETPAALRVCSHSEITRRYSTGAIRGAGSATSHLQPSNSAPFGMLLDAHRKYPEDKYLTGQS